MAKTTFQVNRDRIIEEFKKLIAFDVPSYQERAIAEYLKERLKDLGLRVEEDNAKAQLMAEDDSRTQTASNLYAYLEGSGEPLIFSSHMDTVNPGIGKKAVFTDDGKITSDGTTVLGADDVSGLVSILEALTVIRENNLPHPSLEILFTVAEEPYGSGSRFIDYGKLKAKEGYVLDLTGPVGTAATAAPSIISLRIGIRGRAAHAGFNPEKGINALSIAADALANVRTGRVYENLTVNFGTIHGGTGRNIVPEEIWIEGEIRCLEHEKALCEADLIKEIFVKSAKKYGGEIDFGLTENIRSYHVSTSKNVVKRFLEIARDVTTLDSPETIITYGGSDANRLNQNGIDAIVLACAMENCHGTNEYTTVAELERAAELALRLMTTNI